MKYTRSLFLVPTLVLLACSGASAATVLGWNGGTTSSRTDGPYTIGSMFQVTQNNLSITQLGIMDIGGDGFTSASNLTVGLWSVDVNGLNPVLIQTASVADNSTLVGNYRYVTIPTVALTNGAKYLIGAYVGNGLEAFYDGEGGANTANFTANSGFTLLENRYVTGGSLAAPTSNGGGTELGRWGAANATVIPEPTAALLGGLGLLGLLRRRR